LRELVQSPSRRADLGRRAREFAVAWHGSDACAERYEKVIDRIRAGLIPDSPDLYPAPPLH
jgi:glycosyltransferase involved in cell wall biosynthesis